IKRRAYQENIFINCLNKNSLVVIPTGLGKTIIALMLAVHRLTEHPNSRIIFLAPTKPLVEQHHASFSEFTTLPQEELKLITGATPPHKRKEIWQEMKISFMTPQVLQNDIISNVYSLEDVSLIIFDECHRAVGEYAYCFIAKKYVQEAKNPQILGLTASPGSTREKITEIKENLFIEHVEIKTETDLDVKPYVHPIEVEWIKIKLPTEFLEIRNILQESLKTIYKSLKTMDLINTYNVNNVTRKDLLSLNMLINKKITQAGINEDKFELFDAKKKVANAMRLSHMMELLETQGIHSLNEYISKNQDKIQKNKANKSLRELFSTKDVRRIISLTNQAISNGIYHPKLEKLKDFLHQQLKENEHSRILVFCHFRDSVNNIVNFFKNDAIIRAHRFVGQQTKESDKGLSQKEQVRILEDFKQGNYNVLVATSVAEEGLDIAECDLVVFYDVVPSAIRSIQRRGRTGRKKAGKVLILMAENTRDEGYYWAEKIKEKNMKASLKEMRASEAQNKTHGKEQKDILSYLKTLENDKVEQKASQEEQALKKKEESSLTKKEPSEITIISDHRETASPVVRTLSLMGVHVQLENLQVSDYMLSNRVGVERKSSKDFNDSLIDGRLFKEIKELKKNFEIPILILEGDPFINSTVNENALYGALTSIILNFNVFVYKTANPEETARVLLELAKKEQIKRNNTINLRPEKAPFKTSDLMEFIIAGIPGVNATRAKNLLKEFKTLQAIFNSDIPDLTKVEGVGKAIAQQIYKLSRFKYQKK
ncbi:MAG: DEAD/DEAH box helicase, partial [Promethearchaeota archaeon]